MIHKVRPISITWFERLFFASLMATAIDVFVHRDILFGDFDDGLAGGIEIAVIFLIGIAIVLGLPLLLWYFLVYRASTIARSIYAVFWTLGLIALAAFISEYTISEIAFSAVSQTLVLASVICLFRKDAKIWFRTKGRMDDDQDDSLEDVFK